MTSSTLLRRISNHARCPLSQRMTIFFGAIPVYSLFDFARVINQKYNELQSIDRQTVHTQIRSPSKNGSTRQVEEEHRAARGTGSDLTGTAG